MVYVVSMVYIAMNRDELVSWYFNLGYNYEVIVCFLHFLHGVDISLRQLKRVLKRLNLKRRHPTDPALINRAINTMRVGSKL